MLRCCCGVGWGGVGDVNVRLTLYIHANLGLESVVAAFADFIQHFTDKVNPAKTYQDSSWLNT